MLQIVTYLLGLALVITAIACFAYFYQLIVSDSPTTYRRRVKRKQNRQYATQNTGGSNQLEIQLLAMVNGDRATATRLITSTRRSHPGRAESWYWEKAIEDLIRDRR